MNRNDPTSLRRQVYDLSLEDLQKFPAWEFALDEEGAVGQDEATVRPYTKVPVDPGDGLLVVRAEFKLADETTLAGYVSLPPPGTSWEDGHPVIVTENGQIPMWLGIFEPTTEEIRVFLAKLGRTASELFPVSYRNVVAVIGGPFDGQANGFGFLKEGRSQSVR